MRPVKIGVPQGSTLGPLLFILFINDLPSQLSHSESTMFADDTTVLTEGSSIHDLNVKLNLVAQDLSTWTQQNQMVTNTLKTKTMLIHSPQQLKNTSDRSLSVTLNGNTLAQIRIIPIFDLVKFRKLLLPVNILTNPSARSSFKQMFKFLSSI
ncbi:Hypothetical predicted protein [Paramuricea clavata]|uniref:Uncharacterized protein n=1 Tax=Paramuricea clavata TaxID=317549 RepID=A0A7D9E4D8_PARCT|nr:Hypothetical predicted protein [Paramuricea clavata]